MTVEITCATCGEAFMPRRTGGKPQVRCSEKCRRRAARSSHTKRNAPGRAAQCAECGGSVVHLERGRPRRFCSDACKTRAGNRRQRRSWLPLRNENPDRRACVHCGAEFVPKRRDRTYCYGTWCVQRAYQKRKSAGEPARMVRREITCDGCGEPFTAEHPRARWCSRKCANHHWGLVRSRQRGSLSTARYTDREIFERDGWVCQICQVPVDREAKRLHPDGATIDHVVPLSRGGSDEPTNIVTAHWRCNRDKRARMSV